MKPDIDFIPDKDEKPMTAWWNMMVVSTAMVGQPMFFFITQLLTWGESDLRDFAVIYMDNVEAFIYFMMNTIVMSMMFPFSVAWFMMTWWIYGIYMGFKTVKWLLADKDGYKGKYGGPDGKGKYGDYDDNKSMD